MSRRTAWVTTSIVLIVIGLFTIPTPMTMFAQMSVNAEFTIVTFDQETGEPVRGTTVEFPDEVDRPKGFKMAWAATTDAAGKAVFFKEKVDADSTSTWWENLLGMRFGRETRVSIRPPSYSVKMSAAGYVPFWGSIAELNTMWRHTGSGSDERGIFQRVECRLPLERVG